MAKTVRIDGIDRTIQAFRRAPDVARLHASGAVTVTSFAIAQRARAAAPVDSGLLKSSIESTKAGKGLSSRVTVDGAAYYWRFIEFGTRRMAARPFIRPSAEAESGDFVQRMRDIGPKVERDLAVSRFL